MIDSQRMYTRLARNHKRCSATWYQWTRHCYEWIDFLISGIFWSIHMFETDFETSGREISMGSLWKWIAATSMAYEKHFEIYAFHCHGITSFHSLRILKIRIHFNPFSVKISIQMNFYHTSTKGYATGWSNKRSFGCIGENRNRTSFGKNILYEIDQEKCSKYFSSTLYGH